MFALERVLAAQPNNHSARLELARAYFILEEYARARQEFEAVLALDPPASVVSKIDRFLNAIRRKEGRYRTTGSGSRVYPIRNGIPTLIADEAIEIVGLD